ncbi:trafficking protein particle complex subunit 13-like [Corticium candelabrum]|uniref:trafficking protein particle complex subunit 13-like n=1 Tax=Corticium candelabrum TaxID=121492 RepID=UPI002E254843|nr:trafficking protein particle complex subunit 13-like [Corticium candelabrum]
MDPRNHRLSLKVMRLTRPSFASCQPVVCESQDILGDTLLDVMKQDIRTTEGVERFALSGVLSLPQTFGNIFLGETFTCYICIHNDSEEITTDVQVQTDLQTSAQRLPLGNSSIVSKLGPNESVDEVLHHEVKELGTHILICGVHYVTAQGEKLYFRKFFKFQVLKPLDVKTKFHDVNHGKALLEAQIQNITPAPMYMESVTLEPSQNYDVVDLNIFCGQSDIKELTFGKNSYLSAGDCRQYLYQLTPKATFAVDRKKASVLNVGKLDMVWRTAMGERGRLQTSQLQKMHPLPKELSVIGENIPDVVQIEQPLEVSLRITNNSGKDMSLRLVLSKSKTIGIHWCGTTGKYLGEIENEESLTIKVNILPVRPGLQTIGMLSLTDTKSGKTHKIDEIAQVFVYNTPDSPFPHLSASFK